MARYTHARNSFIVGEVSPRFYGRTETDQYRQGCELLKNWNALESGGIQRRIGTQYVGAVNAAHTSPQTITTVTYKSRDYTYVFLISSARIDMYDASNGSLVDTEPTGISGAEAIQYSQRGNIIMITNGLALPKFIVVTEAVGFDLYTYGVSELQQDSAGSSTGFGQTTILTNQQHRNLPWFPENSTATTLQINTASIGTGRTLTASTSIFTASMVGQYIRVRHTADVGVCLITGYTSGTVVTVQVLRTFGATTTTTTWSFAEWGPLYGYPKTCCFYEERLYFGSNFFFPDRLWGSQLGDLFELSEPTATASAAQGDSNGYKVDGYLGEGSVINFLSPGKTLVIGSKVREAIAESKNPDYALSTLNVKITPQTEEGSSPARPQRFENKVTFINKSLKKLIEIIFDLQENSYKSVNLNILADHIFACGGVSTTQSLRSIAWQSDRKIMWVVTTKYDLFSVTRNSETGVIAWSRHVLGGTAATGGIYANTENPAVLSACVAPNATYGFDEVFFVVARRINGANKVYIEKISIGGSDDQDTEDVPAENLDCSSEATGASSTSWPAIAAHLANETVHVIADGIYVGTKTLNGSGNLTLDTAATYVAVGYHYDSECILTALESNALFGSGLGQIKRTEEITFVLDRASSLQFGSVDHDGDLQPINFRESSVPSTDPTPLFTGEKTRKLLASYQSRQKIMFKVTEPLPCTVTAVILKGLLYD